MANVKYQEVPKEDGTCNIEEIHRIVFHKIHIGDVEDPDIIVAQSIWQWQQTDEGKFVMENCIPNSPKWHRIIDPTHYGYQYCIDAEMPVKKLSEYYLKWSKPEWK
jgi:hypothetical protein